MPPAPIARATAARLWLRFAPSDRRADLAAVAAAKMHVALRLQLQRWIGVDGYRVLYGRAHDLARDEHPAVHALTPDTHEPSVGVLNAHADTREEIDAAIECLLSHVIDLLARIIGADMAVRLMDRIAVLDPLEGPRISSEGDHDG